MTKTPSLILASGSPRRAEILRMLGIPFEIETEPVSEEVLPGEEPAPHVERLARAKAEVVSRRNPGVLVLGGDTVVVSQGSILGKPRDADHALAMLMELSGRSHDVLSGLALLKAGVAVASGIRATTVHFRRFDPQTARDYVATGEPMDKAGGYGIQGLGSALVERIEGDHSNVVGLPVSLLVDLLEQAGRPFRFPPAREMERVEP